MCVLIDGAWKVINLICLFLGNFEDSVCIIPNFEAQSFPALYQNQFITTLDELHIIKFTTKFFKREGFCVPNPARTRMTEHCLMHLNSHGRIHKAH